MLIEEKTKNLTSFLFYKFHTLTILLVVKCLWIIDGCILDSMELSLLIESLKVVVIDSLMFVPDQTGYNQLIKHRACGLTSLVVFQSYSF